MAELLSWHKPGQKVVCIEAFDSLSRAFAGVVSEVGKIYTIRDAHVIDDLIGFYLVEITGNTICGIEMDYGSTKFRPARETSIDCFRALLSPTPEAKRAVFEEMVGEAGMRT